MLNNHQQSGTEDRLVGVRATYIKKHRKSERSKKMS